MALRMGGMEDPNLLLCKTGETWWTPQPWNLSNLVDIWWLHHWMCWNDKLQLNFMKHGRISTMVLKPWPWAWGVRMVSVLSTIDFTGNVEPILLCCFNHHVSFKKTSLVSVSLATYHEIIVKSPFLLVVYPIFLVGEIHLFADGVQTFVA